MSRHLLRKHYGGWNPQRPDHRDRTFLPSVRPEGAPAAFELPGVDQVPVLDQGQQGSCTGHGAAGVVAYDLLKQKQPVVVPSRAMLYYDARIPEGTTDQDAGASVRDVVAGVVKYGVCSDVEFPYSDQVYDRAPSARNYEDAKQEEALVYEAVDFPYLNATLASGFPIVFGFTVYESFEGNYSLSTGIVPTPRKNEPVLGGHCTWLFGYNSTYGSWTAPSGRVYPPRSKALRNSWGLDVGDHGDFYLPQWYFARGDANASDFWVINRVGPR